MTADETEKLRHELGRALLAARFDEPDAAPELFEWHHCYDTPACRGVAGEPCPCSGVCYISDELWQVIQASLNAAGFALLGPSARQQIASTIWGVLDGAVTGTDLAVVVENALDTSTTEGP